MQFRMEGRMRIAFIGLGVMGFPMAGHLAAAGHEVRVFNRSPDKARRWAEQRDPAIIWEGHKAGRIRPYWQIEKLTNLAALPPHGFTLSCFPVKIEGASAGWIRAVALVDRG